MIAGTDRLKRKRGIPGVQVPCPTVYHSSTTGRRCGLRSCSYAGQERRPPVDLAIPCRVSASVAVSTIPHDETNPEEQPWHAACKARMVVVASPRTFCWVSSSALCYLTASHESTSRLATFMSASVIVVQPAHACQVRCGLCGQPHPGQYVWELAGPTTKSCPLPRTFKKPLLEGRQSGAGNENATKTRTRKVLVPQRDFLYHVHVDVLHLGRHHLLHGAALRSLSAASFHPPDEPWIQFRTVVGLHGFWSNASVDTGCSAAAFQGALIASSLRCVRLSFPQASGGVAQLRRHHRPAGALPMLPPTRLATGAFKSCGLVAGVPEGHGAQPNDDALGYPLRMHRCRWGGETPNQNASWQENQTNETF